MVVDRLLAAKIGRRSLGVWSSDRLGLLERWYAAQPAARVAAVVLEFEHPFDEASMKAALARLSARHRDALGVTLGGSRAHPRWLPVDAGEPEPWRPDDSATEDVWTMAERMMRAPFLSGALLWRVGWRSDRLAFAACFHHVIADGIATMTFARELISLLRGEELAPHDESRLPLESRLDVRPSVGLVVEEIRKRSQRRGDAKFHASAQSAPSPEQTRLYPFSLTRNLVESLTERARSARTTLHGAICAASLASIARHRGEFPFCARLCSPISLRGVSNPSPKGMGVYLCALETDHDVSASNGFWSFAHEYRRCITDALPKAFERQGLLKYVGNLEAYAQRLAQPFPNARTSTVEVSNLGRMSFGDATVRPWFTQGNHYHGPLFNLSVVSPIESGEMNACVSVPAPTVDPDTVRAFIDGVRVVLDRAARKPDLTFGDAISSL